MEEQSETGIQVIKFESYLICSVCYERLPDGVKHFHDACRIRAEEVSAILWQEGAATEKPSIKRILRWLLS